MARTMDLNCDMGESFGLWPMGQDEAIMPFISSANIACGFHAGDPATMRRTVALALDHGVALGAHPGLPDREGFGRRVMQVRPQEIYDMVVVQVGALAAVAASQGARLHHVKAHGALYNQAARDPALAQALARAVLDVDRDLCLYALAGSPQVDAGRALGLRVAQEGFLDRSYQPDGSLTPRGTEGALIADRERAVAQGVRLACEGRVTTLDDQDIPREVQTLCVHGDHAGAAELARTLSRALQDAGLTVRPH